MCCCCHFFSCNVRKLVTRKCSHLTQALWVVGGNYIQSILLGLICSSSQHWLAPYKFSLCTTYNRYIMYFGSTATPYHKYSVSFPFPHILPVYVLRYVEIIGLTLRLIALVQCTHEFLSFYYYCCVSPFFHVEGVCSLLRRRTSLLTTEGVLCTRLLLFVCTTQCAQIDATINRPCAQFVFHQSLVFLVSHYTHIHLYNTLDIDT